MSKEESVRQANGGDWNEAQERQYRSELRAMAELLLDIYLYNCQKSNAKPTQGFDASDEAPYD